MRKLINMFDWYVIATWAGSIAFGIYFWIIIAHYIGPIIGQALELFNK